MALRTISPVLAALPPDTRTTLLRRAVSRRLDAGEALWLAGEPERAALLIRGVLKMSMRDRRGEEVILRLARPGEIVGELAPRSPTAHVDAIAAMPSSVMILDGALAAQALGECPAALAAQTEILRERLRLAYRSLLERSTADAFTRIAAVLLDLAGVEEQTDGIIEMELPVGQVELGRLVAASRETTCKALGRLRRGGVIDYRGRRVTILRPEVLRAIRCGALSSTPSP